MPLERVVITGCGAVSPFGLGVPTFLTALWEGRSSVQRMPEWENIRGMHSFLAAPVPEFDAKPLLPRNFRRTMGPMALYATLAAQEAAGQAGFSRADLESGDIGVAIGSTTGSPDTYMEFYRNFLPRESVEDIRSGIFFKIMGHSCAANVCLALGIAGEQWAPSSACTSSTQAIGLGYLIVQAGRARAMLCGGADEVHPTVTMVFDVVAAASTRHELPLVTPRPFDRDRDGIVCGGGSGVIVLESLTSARARGARILGEITGFGQSTDTRHIANPSADIMAVAMGRALKEAGLGRDALDYVNAHATGTLQGDQAEAEAIGMMVDAQTPVSSLKGHFGHTLGAAGALETIAVLEMIARQELLPSLHLTNPDPKMRLNLLQEPERRTVRTVLKNNFALGGVNSALVLRRWDT